MPHKNDRMLKKDFIPASLLKRLRNDIPIDTVIIAILAIPHKYRDGYLRFLCPQCSEFLTATNHKTNLARCFRCQVNFNPIDLVIAVDHLSFRETVDFLTPFLDAARKL